MRCPMCGNRLPSFRPVTGAAVATTTAPPVAALPEPVLTVEESVVTLNDTEVQRADPTSIEIDATRERNRVTISVR